MLSGNAETVGIERDWPYIDSTPVSWGGWPENTSSQNNRNTLNCNRVGRNSLHSSLTWSILEISEILVDALETFMIQQLKKLQSNLIV